MRFFDQNLSIMAARDPELAALMRSDLDCSHIEVVESKQPGVVTAWVTTPSGERHLLHNMEDPIGSAQRSADKQELKPENGSILLGFGLGYFAIALAKAATKKHTILICEADPAVLKTALMHVDLSSVLSSDYIRILVGKDIPLHNWIQRLSIKFMTARVDVISYEPSIRLHPDVYRALSQVAVKESRAIILNRNTTIKAGRRMLDNILLNFPEVLQSAGVDNLKNLFEGRPAVLVAAGPSLEKNLHLLREVDGKAVVIAVDTALRLLLPLGIKPDIVTTIDFNQVNFQKFANVPIDPDIALVYHQGGYYESIRAFHGPKFTQSRTGNRVPAWLMQHVEEKGYLPSGTTVAHLSFHLAQHLGCNPIIFVGQDLAFPQAKLHASDLSLWKLQAEDTETTEDIFGEQVLTFPSFKHAVYHFEKAFAEASQTVIDATEGGAKKQGAQVMRFRDVIDEHMTVPAIDIKERLRQAGEQIEGVRLDDLFQSLAFLKHELQSILKACRDILSVSRTLKRLIDSHRTTDERYVELSRVAERLTQELDTHQVALHLIGEHNFGLELYMAQHDIASIDEIEDPDEKLAKQVERASVYYLSLSRAAKFLQPRLDRLTHRLTTARELLNADRGTLRTADDWYRRAAAFSRIEYPAQAMRAIHEALAIDPDHAPALKLWATLCLSGNRLGEAREALTRLGRLKKTSRAIDNLLQELEAKERAWDDRRVQLMNQFNQTDRPQSDEDAGQFYYRAKDYPRALAKWERAAATAPTAELFVRIGETYLKLGDTNGAVAAWERSLALDPSKPDAFKLLGHVALEQGLKTQAAEFWGEAFRLEPDDSDLCERLGQLYCERGAYVEAGACYESLLRLNPGRRDLIHQIAAMYQRQIDLAATTH